jgi:branched-chain amino acid transport system permease protein
VIPKVVLLDATAIVTILLSGLLFGGILSLIAVGLTLIFGVSRVMNIAHGDFLVLGGVVSVVLFDFYYVNPFVGIAIVVPLFAAVGILFSFLMRKPMSARTPELSLAASVLVTLGLSNLIEGIGSRVAPTYGFLFFAISRSSFDIGTTNISEIFLSNVLIVSFVSIVAISVGMTFLVYRTSFGALMRASMADREAALMLGADIDRVSTVTFAIGISLSALAGTIYVVVSNVDPSGGLVLTLDALTVVVLGRLGSFYGALVGGFLIGVLTSIVEIILETLGQQSGPWGAVVPLVVLISVLIIRPRGLLRR